MNRELFLERNYSNNLAMIHILRKISSYIHFKDKKIKNQVMIHL